MPYRPGTMKKGPNDARRVVWALDKFCFSYFSIYNRLFTKYIYFSFFCQWARVRASKNSLGPARPDPWTVYL